MIVTSEEIDFDLDRIIDLRGPQGNAFVLMGILQSFVKQIGYTNEQVEEAINDMKSDDYEHLLEVFEQHTNGFYLLVR